MAQTEATVASGVKNWYVNFCSFCYQVPGNANWCQNSGFFSEIGVFRLQGFWGPRAQGRLLYTFFHRIPGLVYVIAEPENVNSAKASPEHIRDHVL